jgi:HD-like signal output (HDOD) protein
MVFAMVSLDYTLKRIKKIDILPTFPDIVDGIISVIEDPMSSASDLAKNMDPSMVGEVMRVANTAYFGMKSFRKISTIEHAIAIIGYDHLSYILLQMPFLKMVHADDEAFDRIGFIRHSISSGIIAKIMSTTLHVANPHEVYISGIIHDIGIIIIYQHFRQAWSMISSMVYNKKVTRLVAEREVFSVDHGYIGAVLLENWNIPESITEGVKSHHSPGKSEIYKNNTIITHLGNELSKRIDFDRDFIDFNYFLGKHRDFIDYMVDMGGHFAPSDEVIFFEKIFTLLKGVHGYLQGTMEGGQEIDDTCSCC